MVYGTYNYSIHGVYKPSNITGGAHIVRRVKEAIQPNPDVGDRNIQKVWCVWGQILHFRIDKNGK